jgi:two-component system NarL family sensor kinase
LLLVAALVHGGPSQGAPFGATLALAVLYAVALVFDARAHVSPGGGHVRLALDLGFLAALTYFSGAIVWLTGALAVASVAQWRGDRTRDDADGRRHLLVAQALGAEERERRRLAYELHDEAIQSLLAAQLALKRARRGRPGSLELVEEGLTRTTTQLREVILRLHPPAVEQSGLIAALEQMADGHANVGKASISLELDPDAAGGQDQLVFALCRELLSNAVRHADASQVRLRVARQAGEVVLEIDDDGIGIDPDSRARAVSTGHIGLASSIERVEALGGEVTIESEKGAGTHIKVSVPSPPSRSMAVSTATRVAAPVSEPNGP